VGGNEVKIMLDVQTIRKDFPILQREVNGYPLTYLDSNATSQKPAIVIETLDRFYRTTNANVHRGIHRLSEESTTLYEEARDKVAAFINARSRKEIIFTRGTTEAINLVAYSWGRANIRRGDLILLSEMEHHSNLVPWQLLAQEKEARLEFLKVDEQGLLDLSPLDDYLAQGPKLVALVHVSNVLGTINPVAEIAAKAHQAGALVLLDGAQSVPHLPADVQRIGCDFLAFSGHKMCAPTGVGVLYGRRELLEEMPPFLGGGDMIKKVYLRESQWAELPNKFEAGTTAIAQVIGLGAAVDYLSGLGMDQVRAHEKELTAYALQRLQDVEGMRIYGPRDLDVRDGVIPFTMGTVHPHDIASLLDQVGIAIRAGHHCAMPLHDRLGVAATARASLYIYNTREEIDRLADALDRARAVFEITPRSG
jgi:cysteine desulfurase/selenocysteine lyase